MVSQSSCESRAPPRKVLQNASVFLRHLETANQETADDKSPRVCLGHWNRRSFNDIQVCAGKRVSTGFVTIVAVFSTQSTGGNMETVLRKSLIWMLVGMLALPWSPLGPAESW